MGWGGQNREDAPTRSIPGDPLLTSSLVFAPSPVPLVGGPPPAMNAAHYLLDRMRTCKALQEIGDKKARGCFSSVGSATHSFHGDDAVGFGPGYMVVADGVSGTMKASGVLARMLVAETLSALAKLRKRSREEPPCAEDFNESIQAAIKSARKMAKRKGRLDSTISAVYFDETTRQMFVYTIGDCKCVVFRGAQLVFESDSIIYDFNDENTGGFFICLLKKVAPTPDDKEETISDKAEGEETVVKKEETGVKEEAATATNATEAQKPDEASTNETKPRRSRRNEKKGEVYVPFGADNWATVREYYDISPAFSAKQLITRSEDAKSVTFVTESITMALLEEMKRKKLKVVYAGLKMFERNETAEGGKVYRVCQAGLPHILPFMNKRKAKVSTKDFQMMLERLGDLLDFDEFEPATRQYFENAPIGSVVCMLDRPGQSNVESKVMNLVVWRGRNSVNVMAAKADVAVLLGTMKELKIYNSAVQEAVMEAKKVKDEERAARDEKKEVEIEEVKDEGKKTNATPAN
ncbi:hypothetical protein PPTG_22766 [Phytophthora nicotianae INRA-310]|uniref:PPM-type phosphatase domain-containing protein n=1 Tax=Phytophthora nicotianae (strain INRA-310) TaxID=761204 RepID=W2QCE3_PHYN3|nr:hypothetical protein PPTG_22766 [Phytophthora nicotianae INRA-310]ETN09945.1 hypothetical protein PPTG_22766 [Phytophthora nicotianae INRA-310]